MATYKNNVIDTQNQSDIFYIERDLYFARAETDAVIAEIFGRVKL